MIGQAPPQPGLGMPPPQMPPPAGGPQAGGVLGGPPPPMGAPPPLNGQIMPPQPSMPPEMVAKMKVRPLTFSGMNDHEDSVLILRLIPQSSQMQPRKSRIEQNLLRQPPNFLKLLCRWGQVCPNPSHFWVKCFNLG